MVTALGVGITPASAGTTSVHGPASVLRGNGSVDEAWLTGAAPGDRITLLRDGAPVANPDNPGTADSLGSLIIRDLAAGAGYAWSDTTTGAADATLLGARTGSRIRAPARPCTPTNPCTRG